MLDGNYIIYLIVRVDPVRLLACVREVRHEMLVLFTRSRVIGCESFQARMLAVLFASDVRKVLLQITGWMH